ncbi:MAG: iolG 13, partial [Armatimonadetes bacterium]|nr:iolG 13 [Armatimonadota bacterium]
LIADYSTHKLLPEDRFASYQRPSQSIPDSVGHHLEWINAIKNGTPTTCNWEYSGALAETVLLGNVAYRLGKEIEWDARKLRIKNAREKEYEALLKPSYRGDWKLKRSA